MNERERQLIFEKLDAFPRFSFGFYPTPLEEMPRLRAALGKNCPRLFIKRDDYAGFAFGGNKIRKLEYVFAKLVREGVEAVVATGGDRSNLARAVAAFCARAGIECHLALDRKPRPAGAENLQTATVFLAEMFGAKVYMADSIAERDAMAEELTRNLRRANLRVVRLPLGGALPEAAFGFVRAMGEAKAQAERLKIEFDHIFFSSSTGATHAGMILGEQLFNWKNLRIVGVAPEPAAEEIVSETAWLLRAAGSLLDFPIDDSETKIEISGDYAGAGYCVETAEAQRALKLLAATEGIVLDSVYTAKAFAAMLDWIERGRLSERNNALFWHTGGQPTLFYAPV